MALTTSTEAQVQLGIGYGPFAEAHLGILIEETSIVVVEPKKTTKPKQGVVYSTGGGSSVTPFFPWLQQDEHSVMQAAAQQAHDLALDPKLQSWVSELLSAKPVTSDMDVADVILKGVQEHIAEPLVLVVQLGAAFSAVGLPTYLVSHGNGTTWPTTAVFLDGAWYYASPGMPLGAHAKFEREQFFKIPDLPLPEVAALRAEVQKLKLRIQTLETALQEIQTPQIFFDVDLGLGEIELQVEKARSDLYKTLLLLGATTALIWWILRRKRPGDTTN